MYEIEEHRPFYTILRFLRVMQEIPPDFGKSYSNWLIIFSLLKFINFVIVIVGPLLHIIMSIREGHWVGVSEDLSVIFGLGPALLLCCLFGVRYKEWSILLNDLTDMERFGKLPNYDKTVKRLNYMSKIFVSYCVYGTLLYAIVTKYEGRKSCIARNLEKGFREICGTYVPTWLPIEEVDGILENAIFVVQWIFLGYFTCSIGAAIAFVFYETTEILVLHINFLNAHFSVVFDDDPSGATGRLRFCINYHNHILNLGTRLNDLIKSTAGYMSFAAIFLGFVANQIFKANPISALIYFLGWASSLFLLCQAGQRIKDKTSSIADVVYASKWYTTDAQTMRDVQFVLFRCQKPICYEAIPLSIFDYPMFLMMIKTTYSILTLLGELL